MANVSFEGEGPYGSVGRSSNFSRPAQGISALLIKWHIAKNEKQAFVVQIGMIVVCLVLSIYFFTSGSSSSSAPSDAFGGPASTQAPIDINQ